MIWKGWLRLMTPIFKNGKLNPKITKPSQLLQLCMENVQEKQTLLLKKYHLDQLKAYGIDEEKGTLRFITSDDSSYEFDAVPVGVWNSKENQWIWGWANSGSGAVLYARSAALKGLQDIIEANDFSQPVISCDGHRSQAFSCIATEYLEGCGRFVAPQGDFRLHFVLLKKKD